MKKLPTRLLFLIVAALLAFAVSCNSMKKAAVTGGVPIVVGGLVLLVAAPAAAVVATGVAAAFMATTAQSDSFESGDIVGEEALRKERDRLREDIAAWRGEALDSRGRIASAQNAIVHEKDWWKTWAWRVFGIGLALFAWRNREHIFARGPGYLRRIGHAFFGPAPKALRRKPA